MILFRKKKHDVRDVKIAGYIKKLENKSLFEEATYLKNMCDYIKSLESELIQIRSKA